MKEQHYEVLVDTPESKVTINVYTTSEDKEVIKKLAIERAIEFLKELGTSCSTKDIKCIGYKVVKQFDF